MPNPRPNNATRLNPRRRRQNNKSPLAALLGWLLALVAVIIVCIVGLLSFVAVQNLLRPPDTYLLGEPAPNLNPVSQLYLGYYLRQNSAGLLAAASPDDTSHVDFSVAPGESATVVANRLEAEGIIRDAQLLVAYLQWRGWDGRVEAGTIRLSRSFNIPEIALSLTNALPSQVAITIWAGWRMEQIAESLSAHPYLQVDAEQFLTLAYREVPLPDEYALLEFISAGQPLEGYFLPGTYEMPPLAETETVFDLLLRAFDAQMVAALSERASNVGLTPNQVVILASILEREAIHDDEFPRIASVYLNRLAIDMRLEADPTTQYAIGAPGDWWPRLEFSPRTVDHPYNTYVIFGLPPGPIANPSAAAILGVLQPEQTPYYFFRAACDGSGYHNFAVTYEQHLANGCN